MTGRPTLREIAPKNDGDSDSWNFRTLDGCGKSDDWQQPHTDIFVRSDGAGLCYMARSHTFYGPSETGKSWVALLPIVDATTIGNEAVFMDYEEAGYDEIAFRLRALGLADDHLSRVRYYAPQGMPDPRKWASELRKMDGKVNDVEAVVIDAVSGALSQAGLNDTNENFTIWQKAIVKPILEITKAMVFLVDHAGKDREGNSRGVGPIGAQAKRSTLTGAEYKVKAVRPMEPGKVGVIDLFVDKDRPGAIRARSGPRRADGSQHAARITFDATNAEMITATIDPPPAKNVETNIDAQDDDDVLRERISLAVEDSGQEINANSIVKAVRWERTRTLKLIKELASRGYLSQRPGPRRSTLYTSLRPFRIPIGGEHEA